MDEQKKRWKDFTPRQRRLIGVAAVVEVVVTTVALRDLARRPKERVRGPKAVWVLGCFVQPLGPVAYLVVGRRSEG